MNILLDGWSLVAPVLATLLKSKKAILYHMLWFRDSYTTKGSFVPSKIVFAVWWRVENLTPSPFPSGKGDRIREGGCGASWEGSEASDKTRDGLSMK
jgi:hypothetical protein